MLKKSKRMVSILIAAVMLTGTLPAFAAYPTTLLTVPTASEPLSTQEASDLASENAAWSFEVYGGTDGTTLESFVVLDEDAASNDGKYLIATDYKLGTRKFDFDTSLTSVKYNVDYSDGTDANGKKKDGTNVGWYANIDISDDGGGCALYYLGNPMKGQMIESVWSIEGDGTVDGTNDAYTVTAKAVVPSYTEYKTYLKRFNPSWGTSGNIWTRTPIYESGNAVPATIYYTNGQFTKRSVADASGKDFDIQLVFWVDDDFFKNVKVSNPGEGVKGLIKKHSIDELLALEYGLSDLLSLGFTAEQLKNAKTLGEWLEAGCTLDALEAIGYTKDYIKTTYTVEQLLGFGLSAEDLAELGIDTFGYFGPSATGEEMVPIIDNSAYVFTENTREWIVLDKNENDEFLIASNFSTGTGQVFDSDGEEASEGSRTLNFNSTGSTSGWKYDPKDENNIAYKTDEKKLISENMKAKILTKTWRVEESTEYSGTDYVTNPSYTFEAGAVVPSYSEYKKYADRISMQKINHSNGVWTRTPAAFSRNGNTDLMLTVGYTESAANVTNPTTAMLGSRGAAGTRDAQMMFWVSRDFFTDVTISGAGSEVKKYLKAEYAKAEFTGIYNDDALAALGFTGESAKVSEPAIVGNLSVAQKLKADYKLLVNNTEAADTTGYAMKYKWYYGNATDGWTEISGETAQTLTIPADALGSKIKVEIEGTDAGGFKVLGDSVESASVIAERAEIVVYSPDNIDRTAQETATAEFELLGDSGKSVDLIIAVYDGTTKVMKGAAHKTVNMTGSWITGESAAVSITGVAATDTVKAFVWSSVGGMKPYALVVE